MTQFRGFLPCMEGKKWAELEKKSKNEPQRKHVLDSYLYKHHLSLETNT